MTPRTQMDDLGDRDRRQVRRTLVIVAIVIGAACAGVLVRTFAWPSSAAVPAGSPAVTSFDGTAIAPAAPALPGTPRPTVRPAVQPVPIPPAATDSPATGLDPELLGRFEAAQKAAAADGVKLTITSGWRTTAQQERIIREYVSEYGSVVEAHRYVLPPEKSAHVKGEAIDVGPASAATWLAEHGGQFGLCRTYANEAWHFESVIEPGGTCPPPEHADSSWGW